MRYLNMQGTLQIPAAGSPRRSTSIFLILRYLPRVSGAYVCPVNLAPAARLDPKASRSEGSKARAVGWIASNLPVKKYQLYTVYRNPRRKSWLAVPMPQCPMAALHAAPAARPKPGATARAHAPRRTAAGSRACSSAFKSIFSNRVQKK